MIEQRITLTKEMHKTYWNQRLFMVKVAGICDLALCILILTGLYFNAFPVVSINSIMIVIGLWILSTILFFTLGIYIGMIFVGKQITKCIKAEPKS
jgi:hypothetical protein